MVPLAQIFNTPFTQWKSEMQNFNLLWKLDALRASFVDNLPMKISTPFTWQNSAKSEFFTFFLKSVKIPNFRKSLWKLLFYSFPELQNSQNSPIFWPFLGQGKGVGANLLPIAPSGAPIWPKWPNLTSKFWPKIRPNHIFGPKWPKMGSKIDQFWPKKKNQPEPHFWPKWPKMDPDFSQKKSGRTPFLTKMTKNGPKIDQKKRGQRPPLDQAAPSLLTPKKTDPFYCPKKSAPKGR